MTMERSRYVLAFFLVITITGLLQLTSGMPTKDNFRSKAWNKIWNHIKTDNKLIHENETTKSEASAPTGDEQKLSPSDEDWVDLLQQLLEKGKLISRTTGPAVATTATPTEPPIVESDNSKHLDNFLAKLENQNIHLSDEELISLLKYISFSNNGKMESTNAVTTTLSPSVSATTSNFATPSITNGRDWVNRLNQLLEYSSADESPNGDKTTTHVTTNSPKLTTVAQSTQGREDISNEEWESKLDRLFSGITARREKEITTVASLPSSPPASKSPTKQTSSDDQTHENLELSNQLWAFVLQQYIDGHLKKEDVEKLLELDSVAVKKTPTPPKPTNNDSVKKEWVRSLQQMLDRDAPNDKSPKSDTMSLSVNPVANYSLPDTDTRSSDLYDKKWDQELERMLEQGPHTMTTTTKSPTPNIHDSELYDKKWDQELERMLEQGPSIVPPKTTKSSTPNIHDSELYDKWDQELERMLEQGPSVPSSAAKSATPRQPIKTTQSTIDTSDKNKLSDEKWIEQLEALLEDGDQQESTNPVSSSPKEQKAEQMNGVKITSTKETEENDFYAILAVSGAGLIVLIIVIIAICCVCRRRGMLCWAKKIARHNTILNADCNRWDPQVNRPSKENMNAFMYSIPTPMLEIKY